MKDQLDRVREAAQRLRKGFPERYVAIADQVEDEHALRHAAIDPACLGSIDTFRFEEKAHDTYGSCKVKRPGVDDRELATWTIEESDQRGLSRREWRSFSGRVAQDGRSPVAGHSTTRRASRKAFERPRPELRPGVQGSCLTCEGVRAQRAPLGLVLRTAKSRS